MVDAPALGAGGAIRGGSSPLSRTSTQMSTHQRAIFVRAGEVKPGRLHVRTRKGSSDISGILGLKYR